MTVQKEREEKGKERKGREREGEGNTQEKTHGRKTNPCVFTSKETIGNTVIMANVF